MREQFLAEDAEMQEIIANARKNTLSPDEVADMVRLIEQEEREHPVLQSDVIAAMQRALERQGAEVMLRRDLGVPSESQELFLQILKEAAK